VRHGQEHEGWPEGEKDADKRRIRFGTRRSLRQGQALRSGAAQD
jgi:hypothetical protein